ncbi:MAG: hypothetical protein B6D58_06145 [candidate division Zixibacteria bacterium 4484_95]|nr:MAG: hypothetical protein B6D58_06145 [candidate division Zixibacteria bacterium 4484_95]RKX17545.1 MAG: hypothetical protein DRP26_06760 [candidate division Zixibacteria bacterium]
MHKIIILITVIATTIVFGHQLMADNSPEYIHEVLPNGLTVIIKHNPDSRVFAIDILGKNRAAWEKPGQEGITDFVNRMLVKGTKDKTADEIQAELDDIGAQIKTNDSPYIPYDDRYTWRAFSFVRFETIDEYAKKGIKILYEIIANPIFPEDELEKTRHKVMGILGMESGSTYQVCRNLYYSKLFNNHPLSTKVLGTRQSVAGFTRDDLMLHHKRYYAPGNLIMAVVSNVKPKTVLKWIKKKFGKMSPYNIKSPVMPPASKTTGIIKTQRPMEKEQVYIYLGNIVPGLSSDYAPAIALAVEILSSRLKLNLREKQGLAYSVGAGVRFLGQFGWYVCSMGTGYENFEIAKNGIIAEIEKLKSETIEQNELDKARNSLWGSMLMRNMSCINQAFNMAYYEFIIEDYDYDDGYKERIDNVTVEDVQWVTQHFLDTGNYVLAYVGKVAEEDQE